MAFGVVEEVGKILSGVVGLFFLVVTFAMFVTVFVGFPLAFVWLALAYLSGRLR